jgi:hypothetical protein
MTGRAQLWLALVTAALAMTVVASRSQAVAASAFQASTRAAQTRALGLDLREAQDRLAAALFDVGGARLDEAERDLTRARTLLSHAQEQLLALGQSRESGQVLALLEGVEVARGLIVRMSVAQLETRQVAFARPRL